MNRKQHNLLILLINLLVISSCSFTITRSTSSVVDHSSSSCLNAKQKKKKRATRNTIGKRTQSSSGFGGASISPCPCGSQIGYMKCCGALHTNAKAYADAKAEQVVRARYSAYAKRQVCLNMRIWSHSPHSLIYMFSLNFMTIVTLLSLS